MFNRAYVEITNVCNLRCDFCPGTVRPAGFMTVADFAAAAAALRPYTDYLYLHVMGEPLLHPDLESILAVAHEQGFRVCLTTNGTLLPRRGPALLAAPALRKVSVSLHSFEGNGGGDATDYINGVWHFAAAFAGEGRLCALRLWNEGGAETQNQAICRLLSEKKFDWPALDAPAQNVTFCHGLRRQIAVLWDGTVVPCCLDGQGVMALGNLFTTPLSDILQSPRARAIYDGFSRREAVEPLCRRCGYAARFTP